MDYAIEQFALAFHVVGCAATLLLGTAVPATYSIGSDRYPYTVRYVKGAFGTVLYAQRDSARGAGVFVVDDEPLGVTDKRLEKFTLRKNGRYCKAKSMGHLTIGRRELYLDPSF